ncbi:MAG: hypothetical protein KBS74_05825 [Clostridiales bacterium]|nr:hypothetical protein [Candidatus Cacconaster stercorequi]
MASLRSWILEFIASAMLLSVLYGLLPRGIMRTVAGITGGLIMLLVILRPVAGTDWERLSDRYAAYQMDIQEKIEQYQEDDEKEMEEIIQEKTAAYISDKAVQLGLDCRAQVDTELRDGVPYPIAVTLDIPKNGELSEIIRQDLGISADHQRWVGG